MNLGRRNFLGTLGLLAATVLPGCATPRPRASARAVVVGGGFAGASCARTLKQLDPSLAVTLLEPSSRYIACPFSNLVIGGARNLDSQIFGYSRIAAEGVEVLPLAARSIDPVSRRVTTTDGTSHDYDRLVMSPGIELNYSALPGYSEAASLIMPHAWQAGDQTLLLAEQLQAMDDGGTVVIAAPENPYRCPPGPYERASLIAHYLRRYKPRSKLLILDSKDKFSKQSLFQSAWREQYGDLIEWQGRSDGARVVAVDPGRMLLETDFDQVVADVANVIPPQRAGGIARETGLTDRSGWCPVRALDFSSPLANDIHVIGDAAIANALPKSAFAANAGAKLCAAQIVRSLRGQSPLPGKLINTCYSLVTPDYGISVAGVYEPDAERWLEVKGAGGVSAADAPDRVRRLEADYARHWFTTITHEVFG